MMNLNEECLLQFLSRATGTGKLAEANPADNPPRYEEPARRASGNRHGMAWDSGIRPAD